MKDWNDAARAGVNARDAADQAWRKPSPSSLVIACASDIRPERVDWLWHERLPRGKCVLVAGEGGLGKSMVLCSIAAVVSRGRDWPNNEGKSSCGSVVILSAEDDAADTIVPRLMAADADLNKVHIIDAVLEKDGKGHRTFSLQADLSALEQKIVELGDVFLVIIDPLTSYLGPVDSHKNAELRSVLEPLGAMAARQRITVIGNTHLSKAQGGSANSRVIGSVAFVNHARAVFMAMPDPDDRARRLFLPSKTNLGRAREGLAYRIADATITGHEGELIWTARVQWDGTVTMSADEALAAMAGGVRAKSAKEDAEAFLLDLLADGPIVTDHIKKDARGVGLAWRTVERAKRELAIKAKKDSEDEPPRWRWHLPFSGKTGNSDRKTANHNNGGLGGLGSLDEARPPTPPTLRVAAFTMMKMTSLRCPTSFGG